MEHKITARQYNSRMCFVCGTENSSGLGARFFETEGGELICVCTPCEHHQSYPGRLHGGIASALLDEVIGRVISVGKPQTVWGVTLELSLKYLKPVPYGQQIKVVGRVDEDLGRMFTGSAEIVLPDGTVAVSATGRYLNPASDKIADPGTV
ncbi:MAG: PaaI family thioesterase, partial [Rikenellaceae bacterium]|nr:PaaI family thioesterase [Rikenellaceae bacterium]